MAHRLLPFLLFVFMPLFTGASTIYNQPAEIIEATPLDPFSERTGLWNADTVRGEHIALGAKPVFDSLRDIPGVQGRTEGSPTLSIRGSASYPRVLGLYNGIPLNTQDGFGADLVLIPSENISSVMLLKGPASLFYGAHAMGGAVNFLPKRYKTAAVRAETGSFGERGVFGAAPIRGENSFFQMTAYNTSVDGNFPYKVDRLNVSGDRINNDKHTQRFTLLGEQKTGYLKVTENAVWAEEYGATPGSLEPGMNTPIYFARKEGLAAVDFDWSTTDDTEYGVRLYGIKKQRNFNSSFGPNYYNAAKTATSLYHRRRIDRDFSFEVFADQSYEDYSSDLSQINTNDSATDLGVMIDLSVTSPWMLKAGTRYVTKNSVALPTAGLFKDESNQRTWFTYSEGYRPPSLTDRFSTAFGQVTNPDLKPESSRQLEMGFRNSGTEQMPVGYGVTVFSIDYQDLISRKDLPASQFQIVNVNKARSTGVEAEVSYDGGIWTASGAVSTLKAYDTETMKRLPLSPDSQVKALLTYMWGPVVFELNDTYTSAWYDTPPVAGAEPLDLGSSNIVDAGMRTLGLADWEIRFHVFNVFDTSRELTVNYPEQQRRFWASLERSF